MTGPDNCMFGSNSLYIETNNHTKFYYVTNHCNDANNVTLTPYYMHHFWICNKINSSKNISNGLDSKKGRLHLLRTT